MSISIEEQSNSLGECFYVISIDNIKIGTGYTLRNAEENALKNLKGFDVQIKSAIQCFNKQAEEEPLVLEPVRVKEFIGTTPYYQVHHRCVKCKTIITDNKKHECKK